MQQEHTSGNGVDKAITVQLTNRMNYYSYNNNLLHYTYYMNIKACTMVVVTRCASHAVQTPGM